MQLVGGKPPGEHMVALYSLRVYCDAVWGCLVKGLSTGAI